MTNETTTFGEARRTILDMIADARSGKLKGAELEGARGLLDQLHKNVQCEVNAAKMSFLTRNEANNFGKVVGMGQRAISNAAEHDAG